MINLIVCGISGRIGKSLTTVVEKTDNFKIVAGVDKFVHEDIGDIPTYEDISMVQQQADVIIDFSRPDALRSILEYGKEKNIAVVLATTGYTDTDKHLISEFSAYIPIFFSANMSLGVNLQIALSKRAADFLGETYDIEIIEKHHNLKVDSPSGTALSIADNLNKLFVDEKNLKYGRSPHDGKRTSSEICIHSVRGGTVVGEHSVEFFGNDEILEITHKALSTKVFVTGALRAAKYIIKKSPDLYSMSDIILEANTVTSIRADKNVAILKINKIKYDPDCIASIFNGLASKKINLDIISQTLPYEDYVNIAFSLPAEDMETAKEIIDNLHLDGIDFMISDNATKISIEGMGMEHHSGVAAKLFDSLAKANIKILIISTSETKISFCVEDEYFNSAVQAVTTAFDL